MHTETQLATLQCNQQSNFEPSQFHNAKKYFCPHWAKFDVVVN